MYLSTEHPRDNHEHCPNQQENSNKLYDETGHSILSLMKLKQLDQDFPMEEKPL